MTIQEKRELLKTKKQEALTAAREKAEIKAIDAKIKLLGNEAYMANQVRLEKDQATMDKLLELEMQCEVVINDMPIHNTKTKETRKWNPSRQYGMGSHMDVLTGILSGIQYSAAAHKEQLLTVTGLPSVLIENTLRALGNTAFYSRNYSTIVEEVPYNMDELTTYLDVIQDILGIELDLSQVTEATLSHRFETARLRAEKDQNEDRITMELQGQLIAV